MNLSTNKDYKPQKKIMRALKLTEISAVDTPAQEGARMVLMKRHEDKTEEPLGSVSVAALMSGQPNSTSVDKSADDLGNQPRENDMADKNADTQSADLKKRDDEIARLSAIVDLTPEHRAHYDKLDDGKKGVFLSKSFADKSEELEAVEKANPVVYTDKKGREYRKNDDARLVDMAKERDQDAEAMAKFRTEAEQATFEKKADDLLGLIPGEKVEKIALVRAIAKIDDEDTRSSVEKLLDGANKIYKMALTTSGVTETADPEAPATAKQLLDTKTAEILANEPTLREDQALSKVLDTREGQLLYKAYQADRRKAQAAAKN